MNDIVEEARFYANDVQHIVRGHLERIQALESQLNLSELARLELLESLGQLRQALDWGEENRVLGFELIHELELERDAALERLRSFEKGVPIGTGSPETLLKLLDENRSLELERDAALERVRELEPILEAALIMDTKTQNHWAALESGNPELLKPEARSQSYAQMITAEKKVFDLIKPFRKLEAQP